MAFQTRTEKNRTSNFRENGFRSARVANFQPIFDFSGYVGSNASNKPGRAQVGGVWKESSRYNHWFNNVTI